MVIYSNDINLTYWFKFIGETRAHLKMAHKKKGFKKVYLNELTVNTQIYIKLLSMNDNAGVKYISNS